MNDVYLNSFIEIPFSTNQTTKLISPPNLGPNLGQQTAEARSEIDFRDTILINITLVY